MNRRTFVLLSGAAARALALPRRSVLHLPEVGQLRFLLDDEHRWSLSYVTDTESRVLVHDATLGAWIADRFITLAELQYSAVGDRRVPEGRSLIVRGHGAGVWLEAEFFASASSPAVATVTVRVAPDQTRPMVSGVRFFQTAPEDLMPGNSGLVAVLNGYDSASLPTVVEVGAGELTSY